MNSSLYTKAMCKMHTPNAETYRPLLGEAVNVALFRLVMKRNTDALIPLGVNEYLRKMIKHWWNQEFPGEPFPSKVKPYYKDFVQSA